MKTRIIAVVLAVACLAVFFASCEKKSVTLDTKALEQKLLSELTYDEKPALLSREYAALAMKIEDGVDAVVYMGSGNSADEFAIFSAPDAQSADKTETNVKSFLDDQKASFDKYKPEEAEKINNAVVIKNGNYVVLSVSGDAAKAKQIINDSFKTE